MAAAAFMKKLARIDGHRERFGLIAGRASEFGEAIHAYKLAASKAQGNEGLAGLPVMEIRPV